MPGLIGRSEQTQNVSNDAMLTTRLKVSVVGLSTPEKTFATKTTMHSLSVDTSIVAANKRSLGRGMAIELTQNNHFQFGYNGMAFRNRESATDAWWVHYGPCAREPFPFRQECVATARLIQMKTDLPIYVLFSGGVDSEVALQSFVEAGIPVTAAILRFGDDLNIHDISYAVITCEKLGVPYRFFELDILKFWKGEADSYANATRCVSPQLLSTMWLIDQIPGYPVMGSGECLLVKRIPDGHNLESKEYPDTEWDLWEKEKIASWFRHFMVRGRDGCPSFYQYTPEIMLAYLRDPFVRDLANNRIFGKYTTESVKFAIYNQHFKLLPRPKFSGFEKVEPQDAVYRKELVERFPDSNQIVYTPYTEVLSMLKPVGDGAHGS